MKRIVAAIAVTSFVLFTLAVSGTAQAKNRVRYYQVTVTNISRSQIISPPVVISHNGKFQLFTLGDPATMELAYLAEDAKTGPLTDFLKTQSSVFDYKVGAGPILPGESETIEVRTKFGFRLVSAAAMLVTTNDAFMAVRGAYASSYSPTVVNAAAYDAGSEYNSEECKFIPGPPCENPMVRDTEDAEGYVYVHSGMHGSDDLDPAIWDWNNPVAKIVIKMAR
jgi:hypothetical protein